MITGETAPHHHRPRSWDPLFTVMSVVPGDQPHESFCGDDVGRWCFCGSVGQKARGSQGFQVLTHDPVEVVHPESSGRSRWLGPNRHIADCR